MIKDESSGTKTVRETIKASPDNREFNPCKSKRRLVYDEKYQYKEHICVSATPDWKTLKHKCTNLLNKFFECVQIIKEKWVKEAEEGRRTAGKRDNFKLLVVQTRCEMRWKKTRR